MRTNQEYWQKRAEEVALRADRSAMQTLRELERVYGLSAREIQREIEAFYGRYAKETGLTVAEVRARLSPRELAQFQVELSRYYAEVERLGGYSPQYRAYLRNLSARTYMSRLEELQAHMRHITERMYREVNTQFNAGLSTLYEDSFYRSMFAQAHAMGFQPSFTAPNPRIIQAALNQQWIGANFSDRIWQHKDTLLQSLNTTFLRGVALGHNPRKIGRAMADDVMASYDRGTVRNAVRLARTEFNHIANQATMDGYKEYGIVDRYRYVATLDKRTSEICRELDGQIFRLDEAEPGLNYPSMHPSCRSSTMAWLDDEAFRRLVGQSKRIAKDPVTGETHYVPLTMTYKEWRESLIVKHGEQAVLSAEKMQKYISADKAQFEGYKEYMSEAKEVYGADVIRDMFRGFPTSFEEFQHYKHVESGYLDIYTNVRRSMPI